MISIDDLNKKMDFKTPDGYFEKMQDEVFTKIHRYEKRRKQRRILYSITSVAASLLIIFSITFFLPNKNSGNLASLVYEKEIQLADNSIIDQDLTEIENDIDVSQENKTSIKQMIEKMELDILDYNIIEYYEEVVYNLALLDLYY